MPKFRDIHSALRPVNSPDVWPINTQDITRHFDLDSLTVDDSVFLDEIIEPAVEMVEKDSRRAVANRSWELYMDQFPCGEIELRIPPVSSVTAITYTDPAGDEQTLSTSLYTTDLVSAPARIFPAYGTVWPETLCVPNAVRVEFVAGYSDTVMPQTLVQACILAAGSIYYRCEPGEAYWSKIDRNRWEAGL